MKKAAYYAELATRLKQTFEEMKPPHGSRRAGAIELIRYNLLTASTKLKALAEELAEEESRAQAEEVTQP